MATKKKQTRSEEQIVDEGMDVTATAPPVDPEDASDLIIPEIEEAQAQAASGYSGEGQEASGGVSSGIQDRLAAALEALAAKKDNSGNEAIALAITALAGAIERMSDGQIRGANIIAEANKKSQRPFNEVPPKISVFNLRGEKDFPKPKLKCKMFLPWEAEEDSLDREEIELLNLLQQGEYVVTRNDRTKVKMHVTIKTKLDSDDPSILMINHDTAFNNDYHRMLPPLTDILREMLKQNPRTKALANQVVTMDEEAAFILAGQLNDGTVPENGRVISVGE